MIQEGLRLLAERERIYQGRFEELKKEVAIGVEDLISNLKMFATNTIISKSFNVGSPPAPLQKGGAKSPNDHGGFRGILPVANIFGFHISGE